MKLFDIFVSPDKVTMLHHTILRPDYIAPSEWIELWRVVDKLQEEAFDASKEV